MTVEDLKKYKDNLYSSLSRDLSEFEKNFILISTGVLAFTITFIKDIVKVDQSDCITLLLTAWIFIIISIGIMMFTFLKSAKTSDDLFKIVDDFQIQNFIFESSKELSIQQISNIKESVNKTFYSSKKNLRHLRIIAIWFFLSGLLSLSLFVFINLNTPAHKKVSGTNQTTIIINDSINLNSKSYKLIYESFKQTDSSSSSKTNTKTPN